MGISQQDIDDYLIGATDDTKIGNIGDRLKTASSSSFGDDNGNTQLDGFHRLSVSQRRNIFDYKYRFFDDHVIWQQKTTGSASHVIDSDKASLKMSTTTASGDSLTSQTYRYFHYLPGNPFTIYVTANLNIDDANCQRCIGYFDELDGVFFEHDGTDFKVVRRTSTSGSAVDNAVTQANFNLDKLDGTGTSGKTIDLTKQNLFIIDFTWLGSGQIRFGIEFGDGLVWCHRIVASNSLTTPWSQSGSLPLRNEILNTGTTSSAQDMFVTCFSLQSTVDEISVPIGRHIPFDFGSSEKTVGSSETYIMSVRMKTAYNRASAKPLRFKILSTSGTKAILWKIYHDGTLTGASWTSASDLLESDTAGSLSGGHKMVSGYIQNSGSSTIDPRVILNNPNLYLGRDVDGVSIPLTLTAQTLGGTSKVLLEATFLELV